MKVKAVILIPAVCVLIVGSSQIRAQEVAKVYNLTVVSDTIPNYTSTEAMLDDLISPSMTEEEKSLALWEAFYLPRFWNPSTRGCLRHDLGGVDPILNVNCFAPTICQEDAEQLIALWSLQGYSTRMWQLGWHTTPEVWYDGKWRHFDPTLGVITRDEYGEVDSVANRTDYWRPEYWGTSCPWMGPSAYVSHSEGYVLGHTMGLLMRKGESLTRYWYPLSTDPDYYSPGNNGERPCDRGPADGYDQTYLEMAMDLAERRFEILPYDAAYANGVWRFVPDLRLGNWEYLLEDSHNLSAYAVGGTRYIHPELVSRLAEAIFRIKSPYIQTGGWVTAKVSCDSSGDEVRVFASNDLGNTWDELWSKTTTGEELAEIPLRDIVNSKFDCLVKITMYTNGTPTSTRIADLQFETIVQNNPFALPPLKLGTTDVTVDSGPQLERLSIVPPLDTPDYRTYIESESNIVTADEAGQSSWVHGICAQYSGQESYLIFRVTTPGDMVKVRWGGRFEDDNDDNKLYYSYNGSDWTEKPWTYQQAANPTENSARARIADYETLDTLPPGTQEIYLKFWFYRPSGESGSQLQLMTGLRIDVDYEPPETGALPPVEVTYCWKEFSGGSPTEMTHTQQISSYPTTYAITVGGDSEPIMRWVRVRRPNAAFPEPQVDAGQDQITTLPADTIQLSGSVTDDGQPDPPGAVTTLWTGSGPATVQFADDSALATTATFTDPGTYVLRLTADDGLYQSYDELSVTVLQGDLDMGLFSHYTFDVDASDAVGTNHGTLTNGAAIVSDGERGNVLSLDGADDYVALPTANMTAGRSELTLAMWVNPDSWASSDTIYDEYEGAYWQFSILGGGWCTRDASTGTTGSRNNDVSVPSLAGGQWQHLAFVYSTSEGIKAIYHDGEMYDSSTMSVDELTSSRDGARIGYPADGTYFDGMIDDVRFYDRALSETEIELLSGSLYTLTVTNGTGDGSYAAGTITTISADAPPSGKAFVRWIGDTDCIAGLGQSDTTVTMPASDVSVTATYCFVYPLTVSGGSGSGQYAATTVVNIDADSPPSGTQFTGWIGDTDYVDDPSAASTTVTMPAAPVELTATYHLYGDLNIDGFVGQTDLDIVLDQWGRSAGEISDPRADVNDDDFVGQTDLDYVLDDWGQSTP